MTSPAMNFGVQSYCFRHFKDNAAVAKMVRQIGVASIEVCGIHADFAKPDAFKDVVKTYEDAGVKVVSIGVQTFTNKPDEEKKWFECAAIAGAKHISAHFNVDTFTRAVPLTAKMAADFGMKIGIHCHGGYRFGGSVDVIKHLLDLGGETIGVNIDTAWCMQAAGDPVKWVREIFPGRIYGVHYKDFTFGPDGKWKDVVVGTGNLDLPAFVAALEADNFDGMAVIEYEADVENPVPALTRCVESMRAVPVA